MSQHRHAFVTTFVLFVSALLLADLPLMAQTMVEHGLATGGGSVGAGAAGRSVGSGVSSVFDKLGGTMAPSSGDRRKPQVVAPAAEPDQPRPAKARMVGPPPAPPPPVTVADLKAIPVGTGRADVLAKLGQPSSNMQFSDDGHMVEVLHFASGGAELGTVRLQDGSVLQVNPAR